MVPSDCDFDERRKSCTFADDAADKAVKKTFAIFGVDVDSPKDLEEFRKDFRFSGDLRVMARRGTIVAVSVITAAAIGVWFTGFIETIVKASKDM